MISRFPQAFEVGAHRRQRRRRACPRRTGDRPAYRLSPRVPFLLAIGLSFTNERLVSPLPRRFVGLENYERILADPSFWHALANNVTFALVVPATQTVLGLGWP